MADVVDFTPFFMEVDQQNSRSTKMQTCFHQQQSLLTLCHPANLTVISPHTKLFRPLLPRYLQ